jgi:hypothetical protein
MNESPSRIRFGTSKCHVRCWWKFFMMLANPVGAAQAAIGPAKPKPLAVHAIKMPEQESSAGLTSRGSMAINAFGYILIGQRHDTMSRY